MHCLARPLGRGVERQFFRASALCSDPLTEEEAFFLRQLALVLLAILKALAPLVAGVSVIAPLPERLPGLIEGSYDHSLLSSTVFLVVISL